MGVPNVFADRVMVATTTTGTGTYSLGAAVTGYLDPAASGVPSGSRVPYVVVDSLTSPTRFEVGEGVYTAGSPGTITRATIRRNTSGGTSAESWPAGTKYLALAPNKSTLPILDTDGVLSSPILYSGSYIYAEGYIYSNSGDITAAAGNLSARVPGAPGTGQVVLGNGSARLYYNGTNFDLNASLSVTGNVSWTSDARTKEDIKPAPVGLAQALRIAPVTFRRKGSKAKARRELGIIAQDAQRAHPLAVIPGPLPDQTLTVSAAALDAILLGAVRDLAAEVAELRERLAQVERRRRA